MIAAFRIAAASLVLMAAATTAQATQYLYQIEAVTPSQMAYYFSVNGVLSGTQVFDGETELSGGIPLHGNDRVPETFDAATNYYNASGTILYDTIRISGFMNSFQLSLEFKGPVAASAAGPVPGGDAHTWHAGWLDFGTLTVASGNQYIFQIKSYEPTIVVPPSTVPEPSAWAFMMAGFAMVGAVVRRRDAARTRQRKAGSPVFSS